MRLIYHLREKIMNEKEIKLLFSFTDDIGEIARLAVENSKLEDKLK